MSAILKFARPVAALGFAALLGVGAAQVQIGQQLIGRARRGIGQGKASQHGNISILPPQDRPAGQKRKPPPGVTGAGIQAMRKQKENYSDARCNDPEYPDVAQ